MRSVRPGILAWMLLTGPAAVAGPGQYTRNVAIVIWDGAEILDWGGPAEVFESAARFGDNRGVPAFDVYTVSKTTEPITSQRFVKVVPQYSIENAPKPDIVVFPGGGTGSVLDDEAFLAWAGEAARGAEVAMSVCTGAFILGANGLLDGKRVTTWYGATDRLEQRFPAATVLRGSRLVDNGKIVTTAGVSAGIDGSLHVVARLLGRAVADRTAEYMEYRWTPEAYLAQSYPVLNPSLDADARRLQQAMLGLRAKDYDQAIDVFRTHLGSHPDDAAVWFELGRAHYGIERWEEAGEAFARAGRDGSFERRAAYNAACSFARGGHDERALEHLEKAIRAGFDDRQFILADEDLAGLRDDDRFRKLVDSLRRPD